MRTINSELRSTNVSILFYILLTVIVWGLFYFLPEILVGSVILTITFIINILLKLPKREFLLSIKKAIHTNSFNQMYEEQYTVGKEISSNKVDYKKTHRSASNIVDRYNMFNSSTNKPTGKSYKMLILLKVNKELKNNIN